MLTSVLSPMAVIVLFVAFGLLDGAWPALRQRRATGDSGVRRPATGEGWAARLSFAVGLVVTGLIAPAAALAGLPSLAVLDRPAVQVGGLMLAVVAVAVAGVAQHAMGSAWRTTVAPDERTELVTTGVFGYSRNPIYTAVLAMALGLALAVPNPLALAGLAATVLGTHWQVRRIEEPYLTRIHPRDYQRYTGHVGRFLPRFGRRRDS